MKTMKIDANGTEIRVMGDVVNEDAYISRQILQNIKIQTTHLSWWQIGCVIIPRFLFGLCGSKSIIRILNLSNSIGLKQSLVIMRLR